MGNRLRIVVGLALLFSSLPARAIDSFYLGGQIGHIALTGDVSTVANNAIGFGADLGFRTGGLMDIILGVQRSSHGGSLDLGLTAITASADVHVGRVQDFDFTLGVGPGFYFFSNRLVSESKFGVQFGGAADVLIDENLRVGLGAKYHAVFSGNPTGGSLWSVMMRVGYFFNIGS